MNSLSTFPLRNPAKPLILLEDGRFSFEYQVLTMSPIFISNNQMLSAVSDLIKKSIHVFSLNNGTLEALFTGLPTAKS